MTRCFLPCAVRHSRLSKLRAGCSESEWKDILSSIFLDLQPIGGIEAVCRVDKGHSITITIRKNLSGIVVRAWTPEKDVHQSIDVSANRVRICRNVSEL